MTAKKFSFAFTGIHCILECIKVENSYLKFYKYFKIFESLLNFLNQINAALWA